MAKGLLGFLGFGKRAKPNLKAEEEYPKFEDLQFTRPLSELASSRLRGEGLGFGPEFVDKASNPSIAKLDASFQKSTLPRISSEASKRGIGRSSIVVDQIGEAEQEKNRDVADLISKFYTLNKAQEKQDMTEAIGLGSNLQSLDARLKGDRAAASERVRDLGVNQDNAKNARADQMQDRTIGALMNVVAPGSGALVAPSIGSNSSQPISSSAPKIGSTPGKANILGSYDMNSLSRLSPEELSELLNAYYGA